jgi:HD-GYP domain-containing protein (c-di-GMP phosphodiesterase class II)
MTCDHSGSHSGACRYERGSEQLRLLLVCDTCGTERSELGRVGYRPRGRRLVGRLAEVTAQAMGLDEGQIARVRLSAMLSDVGRDQIPAEILDKRGPLTDDEWAQVRRQPELGAAVLADASFDDIRDWILCRRERVDGSGYPRGLRGDEIPLEARILAVADAYVAMLTNRPHVPARSEQEAIAELMKCSGTQFDPAVVSAFIRVAPGQALRLAPAAAPEQDDSASTPVTPWTFQFDAS